MNNVDRVKYYEGLVLDLEVEAMALTMQARRMHSLPDACHNAAARRCAEIGIYAQKANELHRQAAA